MKDEIDFEYRNNKTNLTILKKFHFIKICLFEISKIFFLFFSKQYFQMRGPERIRSQTRPTPLFSIDHSENNADR